jgi:hypothetical protein
MEFCFQVQLVLHGSCGGIVDCILAISNSDSPIIELERMKFIFKQVGKYRMVIFFISIPFCLFVCFSHSSNFRC